MSLPHRPCLWLGRVAHFFPVLRDFPNYIFSFGLTSVSRSVPRDQLCAFPGCPGRSLPILLGLLCCPCSPYWGLEMSRGWKVPSLAVLPGQQQVGLPGPPGRPMHVEAGRGVDGQLERRSGGLVSDVVGCPVWRVSVCVGGREPEAGGGS